MSEAQMKLVVRRTFAASVERVYEAWTDSAAIRRWFCPGDMTVPEAEADVRVGGRYRICMRDQDGSLHVTGGVYREVVPNQRLVFSWRWEGSEVDTLVTVDLAAAGADGTELILTHEGFADADGRDKHNQGWNACLDKLSIFEGETVR